jgi:hypothetical protein
MTFAYDEIQTHRAQIAESFDPASSDSPTLKRSPFLFTLAMRIRRAEPKRPGAMTRQSDKFRRGKLLAA